MKSIYILGLFLLSAPLSAQYIQDTPWMEELNSKSALSAKGDNPQFSMDEISAAFDAYWQDKDRFAKGSGYKPYKRWENYWQYFADANGYLPSAKQLWQAWENKMDPIGKVINPVSSWTPVGPLSPGIFPGQLPGTGRINAIAVDPNNPNIWYVGAPAGGIWKSTDAGNTWQNLFDDFLQIGVSGIAIDPNDSNIIYIATGDDDAGDSYSIGVFKSLDGGASWAPTGFGPEETNLSSLLNEIVIDPADSNTIWVGSNLGLRKSIDGGATWNIKLSGNITDFKLKPGDGNTVYAVSNNKFYKTVDGGETFPEIIDPILPDASGRRVLGVSEANPNVVYILTAERFNYSFQGLYRSDDSGETFYQTENTTDIMESSQAWFDLALEVSPTNPDEVYMGCLNIWKSADGGNSFNRLNSWSSNTPSYSHADIHTLKFFNNALYAGTDGGIYVSQDGGQTFQDKSSGLTVGQIYRLSVSNSDSRVIASGLQDNGGQIRNAGGNWNNYHGGDGMDNAFDPNNSDVVYGFVQLGLALAISTNAGQNVGYLSPPKNANGESIDGNWITPLAINSNGEIYAGYNAVYKLNGFQWEQLSSALGQGIEDLEISQNNPEIIYAAEGNDLFRSANGGVTFSKVHTFPSQVADLAIHARNDSIIYAVTSYRVGVSDVDQQGLTRGVYRVKIGASETTAEDLTLNLPPEQAYFAITHQGRHLDNPIFVGTSLGVYRLDDTLSEWEEYFTGMPSVAVGDLEISLNDGVITASTYGRGVWQSPIPIQVVDADVQLLSISPPNQSQHCGEIIPVVNIRNNGTNPITTLDMVYSIDTDLPITLNVPLNLASGETTGIELPVLNPDLVGKITLSVQVNVAGDAFDDNNSGQVVFFANRSADGPAINDFETGSDPLISYNDIGNESEWELGVPSGLLLKDAASGTQAYATNLDGNHNNATKGFLLTPCYDFSSMVAPVLQFNMAYDLEVNFDIMYVEYSTDGGDRWELLGKLGSEPNWYNSDRTNASSGNADDCQICPGGQWTGTDADMKTYGYDFALNAALGETDLTSESNIVFRLVFHSDSFVTQEGVVVDDLGVTGYFDDEDDDNDGVLDVADNCPVTPNPEQEDNDEDGIGDACDPDDDNDGIPDTEDNCVFTFNPLQEDGDGDGIGDVCDNDWDNDGVPNDTDNCPDTPSGATVNAAGCEVFSLPANNFRIRSTGATCIGLQNGSISLTAVEPLSYTASLTGGDQAASETFTDAVSFSNLAPGSYQLCIEVEGVDTYLQCYQVLLDEPDPLSVNTQITTLNDEVELSLSGAQEYIIQLNDKTFRTSESSIKLPLDRPTNTLVVSTDMECQGSYTETLILSSTPLIYPNPVADEYLHVYLSDYPGATAAVALYNLAGSRIYAKDSPVREGETGMDMSGYPNGVYILNVRLNGELRSYKIVKK